MGCVTQEGSVGLLVTKVKEPRTRLLGVGLKVKKVIDLVRGRLWPFLVVIKDIECSKHSISIWCNLEGGDSKIIRHPLEEWMERKGSPSLYVISRLGAVNASRQIHPLIHSRDFEGYPRKAVLSEVVG